MNYTTLIDYMPVISIIVIPIIAWGSWVTKRIFIDNSERRVCLKRIEGDIREIKQKLDDFIKFHTDK